jgi:hypothetical protein
MYVFTCHTSCERRISAGLRSAFRDDQQPDFQIIEMSEVKLSFTADTIPMSVKSVVCFIIPRVVCNDVTVTVTFGLKRDS